MDLSITLTAEETSRLRSAAERFGIRPEDLARAALSDVLGHPKEDFERAAERVLSKNKELYDRLS